MKNNKITKRKIWGDILGGYGKMKLSMRTKLTYFVL